MTVAAHDEYCSPQVGSHTGGYDAFWFDITTFLEAENEIIVYVFDPSDSGFQPFGLRFELEFAYFVIRTRAISCILAGKQSVYRMYSPGGDTYTPSSGIWQTVWVENVPQDYLTNILQWTSLDELFLNVTSTTPGTAFSVQVFNANGSVFATGSGITGAV